MNEQLQATCEFLNRLAEFMEELAIGSLAESPRDVIEGLRESAGVISNFVFNTVASEEVITQGFVLNAFFDALYEDREMLEQNPKLFMQTIANKAKVAIIEHRNMLEEVDKQQGSVNYIELPTNGGMVH